MPVPLFAPEETDIELWVCADELPWMTAWEDESTAAFETMEPLAIMERMPSQQELLALETHPENQSELTADFDLLATEES